MQIIILQKLEYIDEIYNLGFTYTLNQAQINQAEIDFKVTKTEWQVFDAKPADSTGVVVYLNGPLTPGVVQGTKDTGVNVGSGSSIIGSASTSSNSINVGTGEGLNFNVGDLIMIDTEVMKITNTSVSANGPITVERGFYGTTALNNHSTSSDIHLVWTDNNGRMRNVGYANAAMSVGGTIAGIPEETNHRGNFILIFILVQKKMMVHLIMILDSFFLMMIK